MKSAVILSLGALALAAPKPESEPTKVAYNRRGYEARDAAGGDEDYMPFMVALRNAVRKYDAEKQLPAALENAGLQKRANEPLTDEVEMGQLDEAYVLPQNHG